MPACRRCGKELRQTELSTINWTEVKKKTFYSCMNCGGNWLYSKELNCPILIDSRNIKPRTAKGRIRKDHAKRLAKTRRMTKTKGLVKN